MSNGGRSRRVKPATPRHRESRGDVCLVDTRSAAHFNGWPEPGHTVGGHLPGAVHLDAAWADGRDDAHLATLLAERGVRRGERVTLYGAEAQALADRMTSLGFANLEVTPDAMRTHVEGGFETIASPHFERLLDPRRLDALLQGQSMHRGPSRRPLVLEVGWRTMESYAQGHLPGAVYVDTEWLEEAPCWARIPDDRLKARLLSLGIAPTHPVVLYSANTLAAARVAHILSYAGVEDVRLLEGGKAAWLRAGYSLESGHAAPTAVHTWPGAFPRCPELFLDTVELKARLADPDAQVLSVRSWSEFVGDTSGYLDIAARGHIPGAIWAYGGSDAYHLEDFRNPDETMRGGGEIAARWRACGITPGRRTTFYCGTSWRASEVSFYASVMGWRRLSVYDGGWRAWTDAGENSVALGASSGQRESSQRRWA